MLPPAEPSFVGFLFPMFSFIMVPSSATGDPVTDNFIQQQMCIEYFCALGAMHRALNKNPTLMDPPF